MNSVGSPVAEIWPFAYLGAYGTPILGKGRSLGSAMAPFEREMVVFYRLSIVTVALSVKPFGRNLRWNVSDAQINRGGSLWAKIVSQKPDTHIMVNNFHKHRAISMPFERIVRATVLDNLP